MAISILTNNFKVLNISNYHKILKNQMIILFSPSEPSLPWSSLGCYETDVSVSF